MRVKIPGPNGGPPRVEIDPMDQSTWPDWLHRKFESNGNSKAEYGAAWARHAEEQAEEQRVREAAAAGDERRAKKGRPSTASVLLTLGRESGMTLIRDQNGKPWAKLPGGIIAPLNVGGVGAYLTRQYHATNGEVPPTKAVAEVVDTLKGLANIEATTEPVYLRFAPLPGTHEEPFEPDERYVGRKLEDNPRAGIAIDLGTDDHTAIVITPGGWSIEPHPVNFRRTPAMRPLPVPVAGLDKTTLVAYVRSLLNVADDDHALLVIAFWVALLKPTGPSLGLGLKGPQGTAKTMGARIVRRMLDPVDLDGGGGVRAMPTNLGDFAVTAMNNAIVPIDNLSGLSAMQADWTAQLMTGLSDDGRALYTDDDVRIRAAKRPVILTGIEITDRGDVLSRLLMAELDPLTSYTTEERLWQAFDVVHPKVLGLLCDVVSATLRNLPYLSHEGWGMRMPDVVRFVTAAEPALGLPERWFEDRLTEAQGEAFAEVLAEQSWYAPLVDALNADGGSMTIEPAALLDELRERYADAHAIKAGRNYKEPSDYPRTTDATWPKNPRGMTTTLTRNKAGLDRVGVTFKPDRANGRRTYIFAMAPAQTAGEADEEGDQR